MSLPNVANISVRLALLFGRFNYTERGILDRTHLHFYTRKTARALLEENGWEIVEAKTTVMPLELVLGLAPENPLDARHHRAAGAVHRGVSRTARISVRLSGQAARVTLRLAAPAIFVAGLLLLPFLNKPFTIDDPLFLREAKHALVDPLHPADFEQVWNAGDRQKLSQYLLGGTLPAYVLAPVAALGGREWMAHLYQLLLLCGFLVATVSVARRLGCDMRQASTVGLLVAVEPGDAGDGRHLHAGRHGDDVRHVGHGSRAALPRGAPLAAGPGVGRSARRRRPLPRQHRAAARWWPRCFCGRRRWKVVWPRAFAGSLAARGCVSLSRGPALNATVGARFSR